MRTAIIIEDEYDAQMLLTSILEQYCPDVTVLGTASTIADGKRLIIEEKPDIVFLDIQLGEETGFELLDQLSGHSFKLIITTAYQDFALKAFEYEAIDYVLKPYSPKSILLAIERVKKQVVDNQVYKRLESLLSRQKSLSKVSLPTSEGYTMLCSSNIVHLVADRSYSYVHLSSAEKLLLSKSLKEIEALLPSASFFRLHASHLVNLNHVEKYVKDDGGYVLMSDGKQVPIARRRKAEFLELLTNNSGISRWGIKG